MRLGVFLRYPEISPAGAQNKTLHRVDHDMIHLVVLLCIQDLIPVDGKLSAKVNIIAVRAQILVVKWFDHDRTVTNRFPDFLVGEDHSSNETL